MASDATLPEAELPEPQEDDGSIMPSDARQRARHARMVNSAIDQHPAWPAITYFMAFGAAASLLVLSSTFGFNAAVSSMNRQGWMVTGATSVVFVALIASAIPCIRVRCFRCVVESLVVAGIVAANWTCWLLDVSIANWFS